MPARNAADIVLLSEIYPPAVGGSAVLWQNVYGRVSRYSVAVVTDRVTSPGPDSADEGRVRVYRRSFRTKRWGVLSPGGLLDHYRTIRALRSAGMHRRTLVHCSRALPEGVSTLLGTIGRRRYLCWAHGEELTTAALSREFAILIKQVFLRAGAVFANSRNTRRLLEDIGIPAEQIAVVYPAVDAARFHPGVASGALRQRFAPNGETLIVSIGRLQKRKGHDHAIAAIARLRQSCPQARYIVVGDGNERSRLEALATEHGIADRVVFTGVVPEAELPAYHALADVFLHPNRVTDADTEGFGIVFLEAQASGKPVVGGRNGGVPETMIEGETGCLVSGEDVEETADVLRRLLEDSTSRLRMGEAGRRFVSTTFSWEAAARAVEETHAQVLAFGTLRRARGRVA